MVRDDLYITVPTLFRCPISLDVMKSPVSLSTGVTYDRASIQRWLDGGNNTCPATMQVLPTKDFIPNHTLQRLIQIWSDSVQHRLDSAPKSAALSREHIKLIVKELEKGRESNPNYLRGGALSKIIAFAEESDENCEFLAKSEGFVSMLVGFLRNVDDASVSIDFIEKVVIAIAAILTKIKDHQLLTALFLKENNAANNTTLSSLFVVLRYGSVNSRIGSAKILESIAVDAASKFVIAEKEGLVSELIKSIGVGSDPSLVDASLSCLVAISMAKRVKVKLVQLKLATALRELLTATNSSVSNTVKALKLLETVSSCKEGRAELCRDWRCVEAVVQKVLKVSSEATEHAVMILWSLCYLFRDKAAQEAVTRSNGLTKILLLIQSNCSPGVRQMSSDLLKVFQMNSKTTCLSSYDTKTTHIMPF